MLSAVPDKLTSIFIFPTQIVALNDASPTFTIDDSPTTRRDFVLLVQNNTTTAQATITLTNPEFGRVIIVKDISGNAATRTINIQVANTVNQNIDGNTVITINTNYGYYTLVGHSNGWAIIGK